MTPYKDPEERKRVAREGMRKLRADRAKKEKVGKEKE